MQLPSLAPLVFEERGDRFRPQGRGESWVPCRCGQRVLAKGLSFVRFLTSSPPCPKCPSLFVQVGLLVSQRRKDRPAEPMQAQNCTRLQPHERLHVCEPCPLRRFKQAGTGACVDSCRRFLQLMHIAAYVIPPLTVGAPEGPQAIQEITAGIPTDVWHCRTRGKGTPGAEVGMWLQAMIGVSPSATTVQPL